MIRYDLHPEDHPKAPGYKLPIALGGDCMIWLGDGLGGDHDLFAVYACHRKALEKGGYVGEAITKPMPEAECRVLFAEYLSGARDDELRGLLLDEMLKEEA